MAKAFKNSTHLNVSDKNSAEVVRLWFFMKNLKTESTFTFQIAVWIFDSSSNVVGYQG